MKPRDFSIADQVGLATPLDKRSRMLRQRVVDVLKYSRRGHVGPTFSLLEILRVLYDDILHYDARHPEWAERDRCILSKGHGCMALYVMLADKGFISKSDLSTFCQTDAMLGGHPSAHKIPGIEVSTGALGHGLSIGVGLALAAKFDQSPSRVFVILGDGECNEGSVWEAALSAGNRGLNNLCVMIDYNKFQSYGTTYEVQNLEPLVEKWSAFGFAVDAVDGHDVDALRSVLRNLPFDPEKPSVLICHTVKGKGAFFAENNLNWHHKSRFTDAELDRLYAAVGK